MKAIWNQEVIAQSDDVVVVEGYTYFPASAVKMEYLKLTGTHYTCPWKGICDYYDVVVKGMVNHEAAWIYRHPKPDALKIKGRVAFWKGVEISG